MIGRTLSQFRITASLGEGGMGQVYRATDLLLNRPVAMKALRADLASQPKLLKRFPFPMMMTFYRLPMC